MYSEPKSDITGPFRGSHAVGEEVLRRSQLRAPSYVRLFHDVYVPSGYPITHELRCRGAAWLAPPSATLTGSSAAVIYGFDFAGPHDPVEFVVDEKVKFTAQRGMDIRRSTLGPVGGEPWGEVRLASPLRMTLDLLCNTKLRRSLPRTVGMLDVVLRAGFVDKDELAAWLETRHDRGIVRARKCVELVDPRSESIPESEVRVWLTLGGLRPEPQINVYDENGEFLGRLDLGFPDYKLAIEYDGQWHDNPEQARLDKVRRERMEEHGWRFIVVTKEWLRDDPRGLVEAVRAAICRQMAIP